jgi:hypothetical protein
VTGGEGEEVFRVRFEDDVGPVGRSMPGLDLYVVDGGVEGVAVHPEFVDGVQARRGARGEAGPQPISAVYRRHPLISQSSCELKDPRCEPEGFQGSGVVSILGFI